MNNRKTAGKIQLALTALVIISLAFWICTITIAQLSLVWLQWTSGVFVVLLFLYFMQGGFYYIELVKVDDHFEVKFYNTFPFSREFKMYRIPISAFIKYEISGSKFYRRKLLLFQMSASQLAKYPPIFFTAISNKDEEELKLFFEGLKK
ncbi:hypothetical protein E9993_08010 [Labilibacter sediminis]|nr:hypothetical protein E9993_08010 [Labilibacter sediminis]